ncbi:major facilitator superfamily domain-containing protein [Phakopsora pachyrhizi]|uniref:Major facilitator superfamily domain-containing protein n=1 Tax=Phakopsora pachyrhizi TaxID=170000 RepID=A0AAV0B7E8_PHAPC|nr:major facilitator superfamily domain-containing protein [Phakopsora pachyrhizi]
MSFDTISQVDYQSLPLNEDEDSERTAETMNSDGDERVFDNDNVLRLGDENLKDGVIVMSDGIELNDSQIEPGILKIRRIRSNLTFIDYCLIYSSLSLLAWSLSLDQYTASTYLTHATSTSFKAHSLLAVVNTIKAVGQAISQPAIARLSDLWGRVETYGICVCLYSIGYLIASLSPSIYVYALGIAINILGITGLYLLQEILIGDISSLRNRLFWSIFPSIPGGINIWISGNLATKVLETLGWRFGTGIFVLITPILSVPLIFILLRAQNRSNSEFSSKLGKERANIKDQQLGTDKKKSKRRRKIVYYCNQKLLFLKKLRGLRKFLIQIDFIGLLLLSFGAGCILVNLTIANAYGSSWTDVHTILLFIFGGLSLIGFFAWDIYYAKKPLLPFRLLKNKTLIIGMLLAITHPAAGHVASEYFYTFLVVGSGQSVLSATRISGLATFISIYTCLLSGAIVNRTKRLKWIIVFGGVMDALGFGLMMRYRHAENSKFELVLPQIFRGISEGLVGFPVQAAIQAVSPHQNLATITAIYLMVFYLSGGIGAAIGGSIWVNKLPEKIHEYLASNSSLADAACKDPFSFAEQYPMSTFERQAVARAQTETQRTILIAATSIGVLSVFISLLLDDPEMTDSPNEVLEEGIKPISPK